MAAALLAVLVPVVVRLAAAPLRVFVLQRSDRCLELEGTPEHCRLWPLRCSPGVMLECYGKCESRSRACLEWARPSAAGLALALDGAGLRLEKISRS